jgi:hypothetical protein
MSRHRSEISHGTIGGFYAHKRHGVEMCDDCQEAKRGYERRYYTDHLARPRELAPHGTLAAYRRHRAAGEDACDECKAANAMRSKAKRDRAKAGR